MPAFAFPESVHAYLTEPGIRAAVDSLIGKTLERTPPTEWADVPSYYDATLAAVQVIVDWAQAGAGLWHAIWPDLLAEWRPLSPSEQAARGFASGSVWQSWDDDQFVRVFERRGQLLFAYVSFDGGGLYAGVSASSPRGKSLHDLPLAEEGREFDDKPEAMTLWSRDGACPFARSPDLASLRNEAALLLDVAQRALASQA